MFATAVFSKQILSPATCRNDEAQVAIVVTFPIVVGVAAVSDVRVLFCWSLLLVELWWLQRLVWCFLEHLWHQFLEVHCDTLCRARQLKYKLCWQTISNLFTGWGIASQSIGAWEPLQNTQTVFFMSAEACRAITFLVPAWSDSVSVSDGVEGMFTELRKQYE